MTTPQTEYRTNSVPRNPRAKNILGKRFGMLVVASYVGSVKQQSVWACACDCGNVREIKGTSLTTGHTRSCGCQTRGRRLIDIAGKRFGKLVAVSRVGSTTHKAALWLCNCDCGNTCVVIGSGMRAGRTTSCGCFIKERNRRLFTKHGHAKYRDVSRTYRIWAGVKTRCTNPNSDAWARYGGRGIGICDEWLSFENFYAAMGEAPPNLTLDRIDNEKGYEPGNCRWATVRQQAQNQRIKPSNKTGHKGVSRSGKAYVANICVDGENIYLGSFPLTSEGLLCAARAYTAAAKDHFGEFFCER